MVEIEKIEANLFATTFNATSEEALKGVSVRLLRQGQEVNRKVNQETNEFPFLLELNQNYLLIASAENFKSDTVAFNTHNLSNSILIEEQLRLVPLPRYVTVTREKIFTLDNIYYDYNDDKITKAAEPDLQLLYELMTENPTMVIELSSHTDGRGGDQFNLDLSQRRAESARQWIIAKGVEAERIKAIGYGKTRPKVTDETLAEQHSFLSAGTVLNLDFINQLSAEQQETAHQINRRTEFQIVGGPTSIKIEEKRLIGTGNDTLDKK